ncbi:MAG: GTP 3',8-cyclase MoaA [Chloroflexota bacterium]|nr:GTP 3',8-cyclase MoaA [Chloroflexota bacterium]
MPLDTLNRPLRDLRISVTDRCNFRCPYCMPAEVYGERYKFLSKAQMLSFEEITRLAAVFVGLGVTKLRITGGEPLVRADLEKLVAMLAGIDGVQDMAMTTNGYVLAAHAQPLRDAGLSRVTVSLDTLDEAIFGQLNGLGHSVDRVLEGIQAADDAGLTPIKINSVVVRGVNDHTIVDLARWCKERGYIARFIEYMDVGNLNNWDESEVVPAREILDRINAELPIEPASPNYTGEVAQRWRFTDGEGEMGVIASVTAPFCGDCTRARLSTDGKLFTCLFGSEGTDLMGPMRDGASDEDIAAIIAAVWDRREDRYSELRASLRRALRVTSGATPRKVEMYRIGG